jgi:hypothetical protein
MAFDGEYKTEDNHGKGFETVGKAWECFDAMGSRWYFYPFPFVVSASGKTVVVSGWRLKEWDGHRVSTLQEAFKKASQLEDTKGLSVEDYIPFVTEGV